MKKLWLAFLICLAACASDGEGGYKPAEILVNLEDARAYLQAFPDGRWSFSLNCSTPEGKAGSVVARGTWTPSETEQMKAYVQDPALRAFASALSGNEKCPQGDTDIFTIVFPTNEIMCWRSDPSSPMTPPSILGMERVFNDLVTSTQDAGKPCSPLMRADTKPNFGTSGGGKLSQGTPPLPAAGASTGAPAPKP